MKIVAITTDGQEFLFKVRTAHKVSTAGAEKICKILNHIRYNLKSGAEKWWVYEIDKYDMAYDYAVTQDFHLTGRGLKERLQ